MPYKTLILILFLVIGLFVVLAVQPTGPREATAKYNIPPALPPEEYGNIMIERLSSRNNVKPISFSHWIHRKKYTCRICHTELEFNMKTNTTEITEAANRQGRYCGACHKGQMIDGIMLFGHDDKTQCSKCHNGDRSSGKEKFKDLANLPKSKYGNKVDWSRAIEKGLIKPQQYQTVKPVQTDFDKTLRMEPEWFKISPAVFPHKLHTAWLDCSNCHPDIFNIKKKTTKHFVMSRLVSGEFCGVCHLSVAFPLDDCKRCHPRS
jgi:c(7)-type cytochrome triheme protein